VLDNDDDDYTRDAVVEALAQHCDWRMAPALKGILPTESNEDVRWQIVTALAKCGVFSDEEMASAVEAYASVAATGEGQGTVKEISSGGSDKTLPLNVFICQRLFVSDIRLATEGFSAVFFGRLRD